MELQIGGAVAPELVWWSRSPAKHALSLRIELELETSSNSNPAGVSKQGQS
jgi:hypothetical protein